MAQIRHVFTALKTVSRQCAPNPNNNNNHTLFRPLNISRAPTPNLLGSGTQCGSALATEIDSYRRRIQTLLHFFDCIAQHWWDHLYPYKRNLIKRPSKSADEVRSYRSRLLARLNKFTMRTVVPAAAAIATMEAHASVKVLPPNLLSPLAVDFAHGEIPSIVDNSDVLLQKACHLARRISDIEKLKQRLILSALTWITSDGRDLTVRAQRIALLARHAEPCLIEHFSGVRALLTHYYRPRVLVQKISDKLSSSKFTSSSRVEPITAARLTSTNEEIVRAIEAVFPKGHHYLTFTSTINPGTFGDELRSSVDRSVLSDPIEIGIPTADAIIAFPNLALTNEDVELNSSAVKLPILPSIVLNPLSIDTSQLDWLSYQINQREFNLHVLNTEEPEGDPYRPTDSPVFSRIKDRESSSPDQSESSGPKLQRGDFEEPIWADGTPITTPYSKEPLWSPSSRESEISEIDESRPSSTLLLHDRVKQMDDRTSAYEFTIGKLSEESNKTGFLAAPSAPYGENATGSERESLTLKSEFSAGSVHGTETRSIAVTSPCGEGEESQIKPTHSTEQKHQNRKDGKSWNRSIVNAKSASIVNTRRGKASKASGNMAKRSTMEGKKTVKQLCNRTARLSSLRDLQAS
ncbi:hypothetical protein CSKR_101706 [Clonorchis sinensis]|uniref:DUF5738 domain-containing protein n=1 Tax=Clonorchis sinensis TaxID=79923 RepID=A0A419PHF3_CLOSI|nr:hypothetical protein CSKR_101706 [Clonorchis sinensis]